MGRFNAFCNKAGLTAQIVAAKYRGNRAVKFRSRASMAVIILFLGAWGVVMVKLLELYATGLGFLSAALVAVMLVFLLKKKILGAKESMARRFGRGRERTPEDDEEDGDE